MSIESIMSALSTTDRPCLCRRGSCAAAAHLGIDHNTASCDDGNEHDGTKDDDVRRRLRHQQRQRKRPKLVVSYSITMRMMMMMLISFLVHIQNGSHTSWGVMGWGSKGHEIVGNLAWKVLSNHTQSVINDILSFPPPPTSRGAISPGGSGKRFIDLISTTNHNDHDGTNVHEDDDDSKKAMNNDDCDGCTPLGMIANWADQIKHMKPYMWSSHLHYINVHDALIQGGCPVIAQYPDNNRDDDDEDDDDDMNHPHKYPKCAFDYDRDCPKNECAAGAIVNYTQQLVQHHYHQLQHAIEEEQAVPATSAWDSTTTTTTTTTTATTERKNRRQRQRRHLRQDDQVTRRFPIDHYTTTAPSLIQQSLMFVTHFIGDLHQPLHSSRASDLGGNTIHVHFSGTNGTVTAVTETDPKITTNNVPYPSIHLRNRFNRKIPVAGTSPSLPMEQKQPFELDRSHHHHGYDNLHAVWDDGIIERSVERDFRGLRQNLESDLYDYMSQQPLEVILGWLSPCPYGGYTDCTISWGEESFNYAMEYAYRDVNGTAIINGTSISEQYYETRLPIVRERLIVGALRLAATLAMALSPISTSTATTTNNNNLAMSSEHVLRLLNLTNLEE